MLYSLSCEGGYVLDDDVKLKCAYCGGECDGLDLPSHSLIFEEITRRCGRCEKPLVLKPKFRWVVGCCADEEGSHNDGLRETKGV